MLLRAAGANRRPRAQRRTGPCGIRLQAAAPPSIARSQHGREKLVHYLGKWYPAGLDMFGKSGSKRQHDFLRWGLRRRTNEQMRDEFQAEVNALLNRLEVPIPDPTVGRRFL